MLLTRGPFLAALLAALVGASSALASPSAMPAEFTKLSEAIRGEKSRERRMALLFELQALARKRVSEIPREIVESDLPKTELLYELDLFLGNLKRETLNPAGCGRTQQAIQSWSDPTGEGAANPTGGFVLEIVRAVCRE